MKEIQEYCGANNDRFSISYKKMMIISAVVFILSVPFAKNGFFALTALFSFAIFICEVFTYKSSPETKIAASIKELESKGLLTEAAEDFKQSKEKYDDSFRLGEKYIFCRRNGNLISISSIQQVYRECKYLSEKRNKAKYYIKAYAVNKGFGSEIRLAMASDESLISNDLWKAFSEELRFRNPKINFLEQITERVMSDDYSSPRK